MATLNEYIDYLEEQVKNHGIYVWGGQGQDFQTITEAWISKMETSTANANRAKAYWKKQIAAGYQKVLRAFDCSGLGMYFLQNLQKMSPNDMNSGTMRSNCTAITKAQLKRGDWVFRVNASGTYHIGYVVDDSLNVIEAKGRDDGVVKRGLNASGSSYWTHFGRPKWFKDEIEAGSTATATTTTATTSSVGTEGISTMYVYRLLKLTSPPMSGDDVRWLQSRLNEAGHSCGTADGVFGSKTKAAVVSYQKAKGLTADGIAGKNTVISLGGTYRG